MNNDLFSQVSARNEAGGKSYNLSPLHSLAQYAFVGTFHNCFYVNAKMQLDTVLSLCEKLDETEIAKVAVASRRDGYMKDMPSALCAYLHNKNPRVLEKIFNRVINNGKMLKKFVTMVESGQFGRRSFGTVTKNVIKQWFINRKVDSLFKDYANMGGSFGKMLKKFHPRPDTPEKEAFFAWVAGYEKNKDGESVVENYPDCVKIYEKFKNDPTGDVPKIPFQLIEGLVDKEGWKKIAMNASWQQIRQSLVRFQRHGVFEDDEVLQHVASKLSDAELIKKSQVFPYQLLAAYCATQPTPRESFGWRYFTSYDKKSDMSGLPKEIIRALDRAMEIATSNVPSIEGQVLIAVDISGSMVIPVTGRQDQCASHYYSKRPSTNVRCVDAAGLIASSVVRKNPMAQVLAFNRNVYEVDINFNDSILKNAEKFKKMHGGGTSCHAPLAAWNDAKAEGDVVIFISDYESWADPQYSDKTAMQKEWDRFKRRCPNAKLICIDLAPRTTSQVKNRDDTLHVGGMSDTVFDHVSKFVNDEFGGQHWVDYIEKIKI